MTHSTHVRRPACIRCLRPQSSCICRWITPVAHATEVLFLQHPSEVGNAKGSVRLLHLSLPNSRLIVGESFPEQELRALLCTSFTGDTLHGEIRTVLLYPDTPGDGNMPPSTSLRPDDNALFHRLVVLDGTWRKSRKMLYLNPLLQRLPRLTLRDPPTSRYTIRKARKPDQLSTFEATCHALMQLDRDEQAYRPLLAAFDGFVAQQLAYAQSNGKSGRTVQA